MDLTTTKTIDITKLALDGLMMRQKAITANTANVMTPDYQRKEVTFENQLQEIVEQEDLKKMIREQNSIQYNPSSLDQVSNNNNLQNNLSIQQKQFLQTNLYNKYEPQIMDDLYSGTNENGNNVDVEKEMMDMAKVGTKYNILANLEQRALKMISSAIKGDIS